MYTLDTKLSKVKDVIALNPFSEDATEQFHIFLTEKLKKKER
ncbi:MAG: hypothetical protein PXX82_06880 [Methanomassiliicoccales archaeon]|nr:hypothetical protein [Methanomassiliicoccales archaeon]